MDSSPALFNYEAASVQSSGCSQNHPKFLKSAVERQAIFAITGL
jgi:hypothetical protein